MRTNLGTGPQKGHWGVEGWGTELDYRSLSKTSWHKQPYSQEVQTIRPLNSQQRHFIVLFFNR